MRKTLLTAVLVVVSSTSASAQLGGAGYLGLGRGAIDTPLLKGDWSAGGGYVALANAGDGLQLGLRATGSYSRFKPDLRAHLDSVGAADGQLSGGKASVSEAGADLMAGWRSGPVAVHFFYGLHWYQESEREKILTANGEDYEFGAKVRSDFGRQRGAMLSVRMGPGQGVFAEWYRGGGNNRRMREIDGLRLGVLWGW